MGREARLALHDRDRAPGARHGVGGGEADVDTVGGLLAQRLGKVPLPGAEAEVAGLRLRAEGGKDARGRLRITSVLVEEIEPEEERADDAP